MGTGKLKAKNTVEVTTAEGAAKTILQNISY